MTTVKTWRSTIAPEKVVDATEPGPRPAIALNVCICWPEDSGRPGKYSYVAIAADGVQICRAGARKAFFEVVSTVTVYPDGRTEKDLPSARPDLAALETRLKE